MSIVKLNGSEFTGAGSRIKEQAPINKVFLANTILSVEAHNRREEISECWRQRDLLSKLDKSSKYSKNDTRNRSRSRSRDTDRRGNRDKGIRSRSRSRGKDEDQDNDRSDTSRNSNYRRLGEQRRNDSFHSKRPVSQSSSSGSQSKPQDYSNMRNEWAARKV